MKILLVDDEPALTEPLSRLLTREGYTVNVAIDGRVGSNLAIGGNYDLLILDWMLPHLTGLQICQQLRDRGDFTPVLFLTAKDTLDDRVIGLDAGADDYLVKPFDPDELDARIAALQRRGQAGRGGSLRYGRITWVGEESTAYVDGQRLELLPREFEVLGLLMERVPRLLTKKALISALAERNLEVGDSAADVYVSRLRRKLAHSGTMIRTLRGLGYLLELTEEEQC